MALPGGNVSQNRRLKILERREIVAKYYLTGKSQRYIAGLIHVSPGLVATDLIWVRQQWLASCLRNFDELKSQELAKIDRIEAEYWKGWETSQRTSGQAPEQPKPGEMPKEDSQLSGDPRFLAGVMSCIERRCSLLGFDAPKKIAATDPTGNNPSPFSQHAQVVYVMPDNGRDPLPLSHEPKPTAA